MPPKRKAHAASSSAKAKAGGKKVKKEEPVVKEEEPVVKEEEPSKDAFTSAKEALLAAGPQVKGCRKVDEHSGLRSAEVYEDYDCMLNQTNCGQNNNSFYVIQVLKANGKYHCWTRWGRVGEMGQSKMSPPHGDAEKAIKDFEKKFKEKSQNKWTDRLNFVSHAGKYTLIEVDGEQDAEVKVDAVDGKSCKVHQPSTLDDPTQSLIKLIFSTDMFKEAMECMNLDIKKMSLGKLSKVQIAKGFEVLEEIEAALNQKRGRDNLLQELSSKFFTTVPHNFGRSRPPTINTKDIVYSKKKMLMVLADIELAQTLKSETEKAEEETLVESVPHPLDQDYNSLKCSLTLMGKNTKEFKIIETYMKATANRSMAPKILNIWEMDRASEAERFRENDGLENRRLLWHGINIAVVAAILKSGLRIKPHCAGRVGRGIYFASEQNKSAAYGLLERNETDSIEPCRGEVCVCVQLMLMMLMCVALITLQ